VADVAFVAIVSLLVVDCDDEVGVERPLVVEITKPIASRAINASKSMAINVRPLLILLVTAEALPSMAASGSSVSIRLNLILISCHQPIFSVLILANTRLNVIKSIVTNNMNDEFKLLSGANSRSFVDLIPSLLVFDGLWPLPLVYNTFGHSLIHSKII